MLTPAGLEEGLEHAKSQRMKIGEALIAKGLVDEEDVTKALASQFDMEYVDLDQTDVTPSDLHLISEEVIRKHLVLPIGRENGQLRVIITDPLDIETLDMLRFRLDTEIQPCLASRGKMRAYIDKFARSDVTVDTVVSHLDKSIDTPSMEGFDQDVSADGEGPIVTLVQMIINEAVRGRASDIHIEPMANRVRVRYRVDGVCQEQPNIPKRLQGAVINRFKIMASRDLAEHRLPQDGRIQLSIDDNSIDFRVSVLPAYHGESVVLRILRPESVRIGLRALGFEDDHYAQFSRIIKRPNGIFLVTGPTGSGKTTTLYSALNELNRPDRKIITAEDPVEYNFTGINQVQVREDIGLTFAAILRSMLRQAPNIILVGEIRDKEVADVAIQAALTGHLVFSTLHTNDAASAVTRLIDMGVKPFLVASSIQAVMAQRLVRVICAECKEVDNQPDERVLQALGYKAEEMEDLTVYHGRGCKVCDGSGYHGRQAIFELMEMDSVIRELTFRTAPLGEVRAAARSAGMRTLLQDGKVKIRNGVTTPEELVRITQTSELIEG